MARVEDVAYSETHRLIPAKYSHGESVLENLSLPKHVLSDLSELDAATNERKLAEIGSNLSGIGPYELVFGVPEAQIVNAAFTHPGPYGGRFNSSRRGAWYAGVKFETSVAEIAFHRRRFLNDVQEPRFQGRHSFDYVDFLADFRSPFHRLDAKERTSCLQPEPIPACYRAPQALAEKLLSKGSSGIVYPSVRHRSGVCIACFRPALVLHPRRSRQYRITLETGTTKVTIH